jgi:GNAT superfamily N-acetyltransferase
VTSLTPGHLADVEARRMALVLREVGGDGAPVDTGWMACDLPGSWAHYAAGLGLNGPISESSLNTLVAFYRGRERRCRVQVTPFQHPSLIGGLETRGFQVVDREAVLMHPLSGLPERPAPDDLVIRPLDPGNPDDLAAFSDAQGRAFFPEQGLPPGMRPIGERVATHPRVRLWLLEHRGLLVGSGGLEVYAHGGVLIAGGVAPEARRLGIHSAFIRFRLNVARDLGLDYATIASTPGGPTERNARRAGFATAYTQHMLERP